MESLNYTLPFFEICFDRVVVVLVIGVISCVGDPLHPPPPAPPLLSPEQDITAALQASKAESGATVATTGVTHLRDLVVVVDGGGVFVCTTELK